MRFRWFMPVVASVISVVSFLSAAGQAQLSSTISARAKHQFAKEHAMDMVNMPSAGPLFLQTKTFSTNVNVVNAGKESVTGLLVLRGFDGTTLMQKHLPIPGSSSVSISISDLLTEAGLTANEGRVELYDDPVKGSALAGQLTIGYVDRARMHTIDEEMLMAAKTTSHALRGVAVGSTGDPYFAISNPGSLAEDVTISCYPEGQLALQTTLTLQAQQTAKLQGCQVLSGDGGANWLSSIASPSSTSHAYAVEVTSTTPHGEVEAFGIAPHFAAGAFDWTAINFFDPAEYDNPSTVFAGIPIGHTPMVWGTYTPHLALHNYSNVAQTIDIRLNATIGGKVHNSTVRTLSLHPSESRSVDLPGLSGSDALLNALTITGSEKQGGIAAQLMVEDGSQDLRMQIIGKNEADDTNMGLHPWVLTDTTDDVLLLYNETDMPQKAVVKIGNGLSLWKKTLIIAPYSTQAISLKKLLQSHALDDSGIAFDRGSSRGAFMWSANTHGLLKGRLLQLDSAHSTIQSFQCQAYNVLCAVSISGPTTLTEGQAGTWNSIAEECVNPEAPGLCYGTVTGSATTVASYSWNLSGLTPVIGSESAYSGTATSAGQDGLTLDVTDYSSCVVSASQSVTVTGYPPAVVKSISPSNWTAGQSYPNVVITGSGFGTQPTIPSPPAPGVMITILSASADGTTIKAQVTVAPNAPTEAVTLQVDPGYIGSNYTCNCQSGQSGNGTGTASVTANLVPPTIMLLNGLTNSPFAGQQIQLQVQPAAGFTLATQTWSFLQSNNSGGIQDISGGFVNSASTGPPSASGGGQEAADPATNQQNITFYFVNPGTTENVTATVTYLFADNTTSGPISATQTFAIEGPTGITATNVYPLAVPYLLPNGPGGAFLQMGQGNNNTPNTFGIVLQASETSPNAGTASAFQWVQIVQDLSFNDLTSTSASPLSCVPPSSSSLPALDTSYPTFTSDFFQDSPSAPLLSTDGEVGRLHENFTTYLMWNPGTPSGCYLDDPGQPNACTSTFIPLGFVTWSWNADAVNTKNIPTTNNGTPFSLECGSSSGGGPTFTSSSVFPAWSRVISTGITRSQFICTPIE